VSTSASAIGLGGSSSYTLKDLWSKSTRSTTATISASVPSHGTILYRVSRGGTARSYEAEATGNTLSGAAVRANCATCSGGQKVRFIGNTSSNWVTVTGIAADTAGSYRITVYGLVSGTRSFSVSVNGGAATTVALTGSDWTTPVSANFTAALNAGSANSIRLYNGAAYAPDLDQVVVG
jgi:hypothetical protein